MIQAQSDECARRILKTGYELRILKTGHEILKTGYEILKTGYELKTSDMSSTHDMSSAHDTAVPTKLNPTNVQNVPLLLWCHGLAVLAAHALAWNPFNYLRYILFHLLTSSIVIC
jgi:hypothetical protein